MVGATDKQRTRPRLYTSPGGYKELAHGRPIALLDVWCGTGESCAMFSVVDMSFRDTTLWTTKVSTPAHVAEGCCPTFETNAPVKSK